MPRWPEKPKEAPAKAGAPVYSIRRVAFAAVMSRQQLAPEQPEVLLLEPGWEPFAADNGWVYLRKVMR